MDYIVNHWLIYLVGTLNVIDVVLFITIVLGFMFFYFSVENKDVIDKKCIKYVVAAMLVSTILSILFPSSDTGYKMLGNSIDTKQNIDGATEYSQKQLDVIVEKINQLVR